MIVRSTAFLDNETIPLKHTGFGKDLSPELILADAPEETVSFALILDDLDVPFCRTFTHWILWNLPKTGVIPEGLPKGAVIEDPIHACQGRAWGKNAYRGPKQPVFIRNEHRYVFSAYALDCLLELPAASGKKALLAAMQGHVLAEAKLTGKFRRGKRL